MPVVLELATHLHVVQGIPVGVGDTAGVKVTVMVPMVSGTPICAQQMEAAVALLVTHSATRPRVLFEDYKQNIEGILTDAVRHGFNREEV